MNSIRIIAFTDSSFANTKVLHSQLVFVSVMAGQHGRWNILHFSSVKCKHVTRSVMAAEMHGMVLGFNHAFVVRDIISEMFERDTELEAYVDSKTVFEVLANQATTCEKRLQIDINALRESYDRGELAKVSWTPEKVNSADAVTKKSIGMTGTPLWDLMTTGKLRI